MPAPGYGVQGRAMGGGMQGLSQVRAPRARARARVRAGAPSRARSRARSLRCGRGGKARMVGKAGAAARRITQLRALAQ